MRFSNSEVEVIIIGGGAIGLSIAYHLAESGQRDVLLLERNQLTSGTSWHAAGIVGPLRASPNLTRLACYGIDLYRRLESETGQATGYRQTGGLWLARERARLIELRRICSMGERNQLDTEILSADQVKQKFELLNSTDLAGAMWVAQDGQINPVDLCMAYAKAARDRGVEIRENSTVTSIDSKKGAVSSVTLSDGSRLSCRKLIICAGSWSRDLGKLAAINIPLVSCEHSYLVTEPLCGLPDPVPIVRDLDAGIYFKGDNKRLILGTFESNPKSWQPAPDDPAFLRFDADWEQAEPMLKAGLHRMPVMADLGIAQFISGPESFTPDTRQIMGESPELKNCYVAAGFNSIGIMSSAGVGKVMAEWVQNGQAPMDLWEVDITRFDPLSNDDKFLQERLPESVFNQFDMHWPFKQYRRGRNLRRSVWHDLLRDQGAVFGAPTGWERPLWYSRQDAQKELRYSYRYQNWWPAARHEALHCMKHVSVFELSPFGKIEMSGADALPLLQHLCTGDVNIAIGQCIYSLMLNSRAGIEAEVTITRLSDDRFRVIGGAATRFKNLYWINKHRQEFPDLSITDVTDDYAILGLMGPKSKTLLGELTSEDFSDYGFPYSKCRKITINGIAVLATRLSYVGETGWELTIPVTNANHVLQSIATTGMAYRLGYAGHFCLDSCRLEKGYHHWEQDIGADLNPVETGLMFAVCLRKENSFIGQQRLLEASKKGCSKHLLLCEVLAPETLILHDEAVFSGRKPVGYCTSGGLGFRTGKTLCFVLFNGAQLGLRSEIMKTYAARKFEIDIAGSRYPLKVLERAPYIAAPAEAT